MGEGAGAEAIKGDGGPGALPSKTLLQAFRRDEPDLVRFLTRRLRGLGDPVQAAEDLAQEAFIRLTQVRAPVLNPRALLFRIAANLAHSHARSEHRQAALRQAAHDLLWEGQDTATPERHAMAGDALRVTATAIAGLPPRARQILTLARIEGLTAREIAAALGISSRAVEKSLALALRRLSSAMEAVDHDAPADRFGHRLTRTSSQ